MMGIETIRQHNRERAEEAAAEGLVPYVYWDAGEVGTHTGSLFPFPHLGDYVPEGWALVDTHFADSSGFGRDYEPALTPRQLVDLIKRRIHESEDTLGWAVVEVGQFQVHVGEFVRQEAI